jgi:Flp pilus assembly protein TadG
VRKISLLRSRIRRAERGAALILIALSMTAVMATAGLIVDGSNAFAQRRQMQNAADSAALAATLALNKVKTSPLVYLGPSIRQAAVSSATANGADASLLDCRLLDQLNVDLGVCPLVGVIPAATSGVKVTVAAKTNTSFMRVVGIQDFTARASATAQIQRLLGGNSPFVMCAVSKSDPRSGPNHDGQNNGRELLKNDGTTDINQAAVTAGYTYTLHFTGNSNPRCGADTNFKGLAELTGNGQPISYNLPGRVFTNNGNLGANVQPTVIAGDDACKQPNWTVNCLVAVPLCYGMPNPAPPATATSYGDGNSLWCVRYAAFKVLSWNSSTLDAQVVDGVLGTGGQGGGAAQAGEIRLIKLSE